MGGPIALLQLVILILPTTLHGNPRRLDVVFLYKTATVPVQQYDALDDRGLPNHLPIRIQLHVPAFCTLYNQLKRPKQFSPEHLT